LAKPDPAIYRLALDKAGVRAKETLFVDDQPVNVEAARNLGIDTFRFLDPDQFVQELRARKLI
jgi:2-haloacid dehalogenase